MSEIEAAVKSGRRLRIPKHCPKSLAKLIKQCWDGDPEKRPTWETILDEIVQYDR